MARIQTPESTPGIMLLMLSTDTLFSQQMNQVMATKYSSSETELQNSEANLFLPRKGSLSKVGCHMLFPLLAALFICAEGADNQNGHQWMKG